MYDLQLWNTAFLSLFLSLVPTFLLLLIFATIYFFEYYRWGKGVRNSLVNCLISKNCGSSTNNCEESTTNVINDSKDWNGNTDVVNHQISTSNEAWASSSLYNDRNAKVLRNIFEEIYWSRNVVTNDDEGGDDEGGVDEGGVETMTMKLGKFQLSESRLLNMLDLVKIEKERRLQILLRFKNYTNLVIFTVVLVVFIVLLLNAIDGHNDGHNAFLSLINILSTHLPTSLLFLYFSRKLLHYFASLERHDILKIEVNNQKQELIEDFVTGDPLYSFTKNSLYSGSDSIDSIIDSSITLLHDLVIQDSLEPFRIVTTIGFTLMALFFYVTFSFIPLVSPSLASDLAITIYVFCFLCVSGYLLTNSCYDIRNTSTTSKDFNKWYITRSNPLLREFTLHQHSNLVKSVIGIIILPIFPIVLALSMAWKCTRILMHAWHHRNPDDLVESWKKKEAEENGQQTSTTQTAVPLNAVNELRRIKELEEEYRKRLDSAREMEGKEVKSNNNKKKSRSRNGFKGTTMQDNYSQENSPTKQRSSELSNDSIGKTVVEEKNLDFYFTKEVTYLLSKLRRNWDYLSICPKIQAFGMLLFVTNIVFSQVICGIVLPFLHQYYANTINVHNTSIISNSPSYLQIVKLLGWIFSIEVVLLTFLPILIPLSAIFVYNGAVFSIFIAGVLVENIEDLSFNVDFSSFFFRFLLAPILAMLFNELVHGFSILLQRKYIWKNLQANIMDDKSVSDNSRQDRVNTQNRNNQSQFSIKSSRKCSMMSMNQNHGKMKRCFHKCWYNTKDWFLNILLSSRCLLLDSLSFFQVQNFSLYVRTNIHYRLFRLNHPIVRAIDLYYTNGIKSDRENLASYLPHWVLISLHTVQSYPRFQSICLRSIFFSKRAFKSMVLLTLIGSLLGSSLIEVNSDNVNFTGFKTYLFCVSIASILITYILLDFVRSFSRVMMGVFDVLDKKYEECVFPRFDQVDLDWREHEGNILNRLRKQKTPEIMCPFSKRCLVLGSSISCISAFLLLFLGRWCFPGFYEMNTSVFTSMVKTASTVTFTGFSMISSGISSGVARVETTIISPIGFSLLILFVLSNIFLLVFYINRHFVFKDMIERRRTELRNGTEATMVNLSSEDIGRKGYPLVGVPRHSLKEDEDETGLIQNVSSPFCSKTPDRNSRNSSNTKLPEVNRRGSMYCMSDCHIPPELLTGDQDEAKESSKDGEDKPNANENADEKDDGKNDAKEEGDGKTDDISTNTRSRNTRSRNGGLCRKRRNWRWNHSNLYDLLQDEDSQHIRNGNYSSGSGVTSNGGFHLLYLSFDSISRTFEIDSTQNMLLKVGQRLVGYISPEDYFKTTEIVLSDLSLMRALDQQKRNQRIINKLSSIPSCSGGSASYCINDINNITSASVVAPIMQPSTITPQRSPQRETNSSNSPDTCKTQVGRESIDNGIGVDNDIPNQKSNPMNPSNEPSISQINRQSMEHQQKLRASMEYLNRMSMEQANRMSMQRMNRFIAGNLISSTQKSLVAAPCSLLLGSNKKKTDKKSLKKAAPSALLGSKVKIFGKGNKGTGDDNQNGNRNGRNDTPPQKSIRNPTFGILLENGNGSSDNTMHPTTERDSPKRTEDFIVKKSSLDLLDGTPSPPHLDVRNKSKPVLFDDVINPLDVSDDKINPYNSTSNLYANTLLQDNDDTPNGLKTLRDTYRFLFPCLLESGIGVTGNNKLKTLYFRDISEARWKHERSRLALDYEYKLSEKKRATFLLEGRERWSTTSCTSMMNGMHRFTNGNNQSIALRSSIMGDHIKNRNSIDNIRNRNTIEHIRHSMGLMDTITGSSNTSQVVNSNMVNRLSMPGSIGGSQCHIECGAYAGSLYGGSQNGSQIGSMDPGLPSHNGRNSMATLDSQLQFHLGSQLGSQLGSHRCSQAGSAREGNCQDTTTDVQQIRDSVGSMPSIPGHQSNDSEGKTVSFMTRLSQTFSKVVSNPKPKKPNQRDLMELGMAQRIYELENQVDQLTSCLKMVSDQNRDHLNRTMNNQVTGQVNQNHMPGSPNDVRRNTEYDQVSPFVVTECCTTGIPTQASPLSTDPTSMNVGDRNSPQKSLVVKIP